MTKRVAVHTHSIDSTPLFDNDNSEKRDGYEAKSESQ